MDKTSIKPTKGHVLVRPNEKPKEVGGIILAGENQNSAPVYGEVLRANFWSPFRAGQTIYFRKYAIDELKFLAENGTEDVVYLIDEREVLGVVKPPFSLRNLLK